MLRWLRKLRIDEDGATAVEYGLILALVVLATMGALMNLADGTISMWTNVAAEVEKS